MLKIGEKNKIHVGRPRKVSNQSADPAVKLVDDSSSEDGKVQKVKAKKLRKMYSAGQKKSC